MRNAYPLSIGFVALIVALMGACTQAPTHHSNDTGCADKMGSLVDLTEIAIYRDAALTQKEISAESHAILIGSSSDSFRLLRSDGEIVWASEIKKCTPIAISGATDTINVTTQPLSKEGDDPAFEWQKIAANIFLKLSGSSAEAYPMSPEYLRLQGRILPSSTAGHQLSWPELQITINHTIAWVSPEELQFRAAKPLNVYGLLQKPFITLAARQPSDILSGQKISYQDFTDNKVAVEQTVIQNEDLAQLIIPQPLNPTIPIRIGLHTTSENCSLFQAVWATGEANYFGYCKYGTSGPTPYIVGYEVPETGDFTDLNVLEVFGDDAEPVRFRLSIKDGAIKVLRLDK